MKLSEILIKIDNKSCNSTDIDYLVIRKYHKEYMIVTSNSELIRSNPRTYWVFTSKIADMSFIHTYMSSKKNLLKKNDGILRKYKIMDLTLEEFLDIEIEYLPSLEDQLKIIEIMKPTLHTLLINEARIKKLHETNEEKFTNFIKDRMYADINIKEISKNINGELFFKNVFSLTRENNSQDYFDEKLSNEYDLLLKLYFYYGRDLLFSDMEEIVINHLSFDKCMAPNPNLIRPVGKTFREIQDNYLEIQVRRVASKDIIEMFCNLIHFIGPKFCNNNNNTC